MSNETKQVTKVKATAKPDTLGSKFLALFSREELKSTVTDWVEHKVWPETKSYLYRVTEGLLRQTLGGGGAGYTGVVGGTSAVARPNNAVNYNGVSNQIGTNRSGPTQVIALRHTFRNSVDAATGDIILGKDEALKVVRAVSDVLESDYGKVSVLEFCEFAGEDCHYTGSKYGWVAPFKPEEWIIQDIPDGVVLTIPKARPLG